MSDKSSVDYSRYTIIDNETGEVLPSAFFTERVEEVYWEKAFVKTLSNYIGCTGTSTSLVLSYLIKNKTTDNLINGTASEIAVKTNSSRKTVNRVFSILIKEKMLTKIRNGCYLLSPFLLRNGSQIKAAIIIRRWDDLQSQKPKRV